MKHIQKKFALYSSNKEFKRKLEESTLENFSIKSDPNIREKVKKYKDGDIAFITTDKNFSIVGIVYKENGNPYILPIPDPTLVYFSNAQYFMSILPETKQKLLEKIGTNNLSVTTAINETYHFFGAMSGFAIFLFSSIESFINQQIPHNFVYKNELNKKTELFNKTQIQEHLDFKTKITKVLKEATGKDFFKSKTPAIQMIWNLKEFRDSIIHTKQEDEKTRYQQLMRLSLKFKYEKALKATVSFMNFYLENYVVECDCNDDY